MSAELELERLERQVLGVARVSRFVDTVERLKRMLAQESPEIRARVLALVAPAIGRDLAAAVSSAFSIGAADAFSIIGEGRTPVISDTPPPALVDAARKTERDIAASVSRARNLARTGADAATVLAPVFEAGNILQRDVVTLVNAAGNAGVTAVADAAQVPTVWVAETNACVTCLAYSGRVADPGQAFPAGLSYGARSTVAADVSYPPAHPYCRCQVEPLNDQSYADALRREADRSVLRGFSLESESMKTRVDAARRLLEADVVAPASVKAYARRAVRAGEFPTRGR